MSVTKDDTVILTENILIQTELQAFSADVLWFYRN